jgi:RNA polymerase sigma-70 factor (ECF subfamily)
MVPDREDFLRTLDAARAGDDTGLTRLFQLLYPAVLRYLRVTEPTEAEDLASETWLDVAHALRGFEGDERGLRALALTIARRRVVDLRRRRARQGIIPTEPEHLAALGAVGDAEEEAVSRLELDEAIERLRALPPDQAEVILLRVLGGLGVEEVASIMGKRRGTVRVLQHRGLRALARTASEHAIWSNGVTR